MNWIFWLVLIILLTVIEVCTTNLVTIWFVVSALVSLIVSFFTLNPVILSSIFVILGIILLITTKPILKKFFDSKNTDINLDRIIGKKAIVTENITKNSVGEVKVDGKRWSAISNENLVVGDAVRVLEINGVKLIVEKESD